MELYDIMSVEYALGALFLVAVVAFVVIYTLTLKDPSFAEKMPAWWVKFVKGGDAPSETEKDEKKKEEDHATLVSSAVGEAIKGGVAIDVEKWKRAVHAALSDHLDGLRQKRDALKRGSTERAKADDDVNEFKAGVDMLEIRFTRDLNSNPQTAMSNLLNMVLPIGASKDLVKSTMSSPDTWVKAEGATTALSNYILTAYS
eukprot:jgi/Mesvir1/11061/Mv12671-RA.1